jgi:hypothetical protein
MTVAAKLIPVSDWPGYFAGDDGRIYSTRVSREPRPLAVCPDDDGRPRVNLCRGAGRRRSFKVCRLIAIAFHGLPPAAALKNNKMRTEA